MKDDSKTIEAEEKGNRSITPFSALNIILIVIWFGLITGLIESTFLVGWRQYYRQNVIHTGSNLLWMAPLAEMLIFILFGLIIAIFAKFIPSLFTNKTIIFFVSLLSFITILLLFPQIHHYVKWILGIGLAVQTARILGNHSVGFYKFVSRTSILVLVVVIGLIVGTLSWERLSEQQALSKLPPPAISNSPNVILITLDTVRAESLSVYGYERKTTPQLEKFAQDGAVFEQAITTASWTLPSHASMLTGKLPHEMNVRWYKAIKPKFATLPEVLQQRGYETSGFAANLLFCSKEYGLSRGIIHYEDYPVSLGQIILSSTIGQEISNTGFVRRAVDYHQNLNSKSAEKINDDFLNWLESRDSNRPFFTFINYFDAHEPLLPPKPFDTMYGSTKPNGEYLYQTIGIDFLNKHAWTTEDADTHRNAYDSSITYLDQQLGILFSKLSEKGILDNTIVIITSDHGESFGEHGIYSHGNSLYIETLRVPLIVRFPGKVQKGQRIQQPVSLRDIPSTVLGLIGIPNNENNFSGQSLGRYFQQESGKAAANEDQIIFSELEEASWIDAWYPASKGNMKSLLNDKYHYIWSENGTEELYDLKSDPKELINLSKNTEAQNTMEMFRNELKKYPE